MDQAEARRAFEVELAGVIDRHWDTIRPEKADDVDLDPLDVAELGDTYPSCWVLLLGCSSIANPDAHISIRVTPRGQSPFTGIGLIEDIAADWKG